MRMKEKKENVHESRIKTNIQTNGIDNDLVSFLNESAHDLFARTDIVEGIHCVLRRIQRFFGADRAYVIECDYVKNTSSNTYEVVKDGVSSEIENLQGVPNEEYSYWFNGIVENKYMSIPDVSKLGEERASEREILESQDIHSLMAVPLWRDSILIGFMGIDNPTKNTREDIKLLALGDYLSIALLSRDNQRSIEEENAFYSRMLNNLPGGLALYKYGNNVMEEQFINDGYYSMLGVSREERECYTGQSSFSAVLPEDLPTVQRAVREAAKDGKPHKIDLRIRIGEDGYKWVQAYANIVKEKRGTYTVYVCYSDIDGLKTLQLQLATRQKAMSMASESGNINFWIYDIDKKEIKLVFDEQVPTSFLRKSQIQNDSVLNEVYIHVEDRSEFKRMYEELEQNVDKSECIVRVMNFELSQFEWRHIQYTRLDDDMYGNRTAIGYSTSANREQENRQHYEKEIQLRREMLKSSDTYYQMNISKGIIEEYYSKNHYPVNIHSGQIINQRLRDAIEKAVAPDSWELIQNTLFAKPLKAMLDRGEANTDVIFKSLLPNGEIRWSKASATVMSRYHSDDIIAFIYIKDIDRMMKDQMAIEATMDEEIEAVVVVELFTGMAHYVKMSNLPTESNSDNDFIYEAMYRAVVQPQLLKQDTLECNQFFTIKELIRRLETEPVIKHTYRTRNSDGRIRHKKARAFYLDDNHDEIILIRGDVTDIYVEEQAKKRALQKALDEANIANAAKGEFISRMSHDMRTPLNAVLSYSSDELLQGATKEEQREYLGKIHASSSLLLRIINDVLDMSKIDQNKLVLKPVPYSMDDFTQVVDSVIEEPCKAKNITFHFEKDDIISEWVMLDKLRYEQIMVNLLSNAVKFTNPHGEITLRIESINSKDGVVYSKHTITDNGIGMSKEFLPLAFDNFSQEDNGDLIDNLGTGLGLSIVKKLVRLMDGTIDIRSERGVGTEVKVILPLHMAKSPKNGKRKKTIKNRLQGLRVLVCEDNDINYEIVEMLLQKQGSIPVRAENGQVGCELFQTSEVGYYKAILMDIRMPIMDGYEATKEIRNMPREDARSIPIIAMTADAFAKDEKAAQTVGMNAHISKPIDPQLMYETLEKIKQAM